MGTYTQVYDPFGNTIISTIVAAFPIVLLLGLIATGKIKSHWAALLGLAAMVLVAIFAYRMPTNMALSDTAYGFERFQEKSSPLIGPGGIGAPRGDGEFRQIVTASKLEEGVHFLTVRAWRHRTDGGPAVYSDFKRAIYVDRLPPQSRVESAQAAGGGLEIDVRSTDGTAARVYAYIDLPANTSKQAILARTDKGEGQLARVDRDLFRAQLAGVASGSHVLTIATFEPTGTRNIQRETVTVP